MVSTRIVAGVVATAAVSLAMGAAGAKEIVVAVPGIPGPYCAYGAEKRLLELTGIEAVTTSWERQEIRIVANDGARITVDDIKQAMRRADYPYKYEIRTGRDE